MASRIFDVDWSQVTLGVNRDANATLPTSGPTWNVLGDNGDLLSQDNFGKAVFYQEIDLEQLTIEGRTFSPKGVEVQRPWTAPLGQDWNYVPTTRHYEFLYIFTAPLANQTLTTISPNLDAFFDLGLDVSGGGRGSRSYTGREIPNAEQCVFAQSTICVNNVANSLSVWNGTLVEAAPGPPPITGDILAPLASGEMTISEVNQWGSLPTILGPKLFCYRFISYPSQILSGLSIDNPLVKGAGFTARNMSSLCIKLVCEEVNLSDSEYIITAANAYNMANQDDVNLS